MYLNNLNFKLTGIPMVNNINEKGQVTQNWKVNK